LHWKTHKEWGNHLAFGEHILKNELMDVISKSMVHVFIRHRLGSWIKSILKDYYYYTNTEEVERIHDIARGIFLGEDEDGLHLKSKKENISGVLYSLFVANIKDTSSVHYDSIVKFRLKVFKDHLIHHVGLAIDEFKQEENHQEFIHMLRDYISNKEPGIPVIYILQGKSFQFFKENGKRLTELDLRKIMRKKPLYILGLDENERNLTPLIAMAPKKIKIFGDDPSEAKTLTVINIFQEKVDFVPYTYFPFLKHFKNEP